MKTLILILAILLCSSLVRAAPVTLAWDPNTEANLVGYRIYQSNVSGTYDKTTQKVADIPKGTQSVFLQITPEDGRKVYFAATAYSALGESLFSNEVIFTVPDTRPPVAPKNFKIVIKVSMSEDRELLMTSSEMAEE